jgi:uncharacterized FlaG/YvyC family protein
MDVSPIQRMAITANHAARPVAPARGPAVAATAQAKPVAADQQATRHVSTESKLNVEVAWHGASMGYVTRIVDQHTGTVLMSTPPEQVLKMVQQVIERLEGQNR